ncbi:MAG: transglutaminase-like domain-containing protein [Candidatus Kryptoniota bacterium]
MKTFAVIPQTSLVLAVLVQMVFACNLVAAGYHVRNNCVVRNIDCSLTKLIVIIPLAQTNQYQVVTNLNVKGGQVLPIPETDDKYIRWIDSSALPAAGQSIKIGYEFDVVLKKFIFDFNSITTIYPYDTSSNIYHWYTGKSGAYVDPDNATIQTIGSTLWNQSSSIVDYARRCYLYVAQNYQYLDANTGLHTLADILASGGGDCGNLSSIYVSLLRFKGIPSRHIVTVRPDGSYHVWTDFYLETYGWIPVDVTYKNSNPSGDYFGKYDGNGIVMTKGVWLLLDRDDGYSYHCDLLQTYNWWYWLASGGGQIVSSHSLTSMAGVGESQSFPGRFMLGQNYPNPFNPSTIINYQLPTNSFVTLRIYDVLGSEVATLVNARQSAGYYNATFIAAALPKRRSWFF